MYFGFEFDTPSPLRRWLTGFRTRNHDQALANEHGIPRRTLGRTDASGVATLILRPGTTKIIAEPAMGVADLPTSQSFEFKTDSRNHAIELELSAAAEVNFEAIEKETGKPVPSVAFMSEPNEARERLPVQSQISFVDHPRTDATGKLRAFFAPGGDGSSSIRNDLCVSSSPFHRPPMRSNLPLDSL